MPKKSAAHLKKVDEAVRILGTTTSLKLRQAMILAGFSKKDISDDSVCRMLRRRLEALGVKQRRHGPTIEVRMMTTNDSVVSSLTEDQQALVSLIVEHNVIACNALSLEGYNGDVMKITLKPVERTTVLTVPHSQEWIELLSRAKTHGNIFTATGGVHLTANDIFKGIVLKQCKVEHEKLTKEKTVRMRQEKTAMNAMIIQAVKGGMSRNLPEPT